MTSQSTQPAPTAAPAAAAETRPGLRVITVRRDVLATVHEQAEDFRRARAAEGTLVVNLLASPGAGKTSLLAATAQLWRGRRRLAVLVGDIATDRDAQRIAPYAPAVQLTTGGACHLEHPLVSQGWRALCDSQGAEGQAPLPLDFLFIENIGNLVCPASHDLGEHLRVLLLSTTEGDDKPAKYPKAFRTSHALVVSKCDLLPHLPFSLDAAAADARTIQPNLAVLPVSVRPSCGLTEWCDYLDQQRARLLAGDVCRPLR